MKIDIEKGANYAMIPALGVGIINAIVLVAIVFCVFWAMHVCWFEDFGNPALALLCLFVDSSIILGICGLFDIDMDKALTITVCILFAPVAIPILLLWRWGCKLEERELQRLAEQEALETEQNMVAEEENS